MANYLGYEFIDAAEVIVFHEDGTFDAETTNEKLSARLAECEQCSHSWILRCNRRTER